MVWRFEGETWTPSPDGEVEPLLDQAEVSAANDTISVGTSVADAVDRIIQLTLGKVLDQKKSAMAGLPLQTQHVIADRISQAREMFAAELTALAETKKSEDGRWGVISDADIMEVLAKVGPNLSFAQ